MFACGFGARQNVRSPLYEQLWLCPAVRKSHNNLVFTGREGRRKLKCVDKVVSFGLFSNDHQGWCLSVGIGDIQVQGCRSVLYNLWTNLQQRSPCQCIAVCCNNVLALITAMCYWGMLVATNQSVCARAFVCKLVHFSVELWHQKIAGNKVKLQHHRLHPACDWQVRQKGTGQRELKACTTKHVILRNLKSKKSYKLSDSSALVVNPEDKQIWSPFFLSILFCWVLLSDHHSGWLHFSHTVLNWFW